MRILRPVYEEVDFDGKTRRLPFNVLVIDEIQEHFDMGIADVLNSFFNKDSEVELRNAIAYVFTVSINEDTRLHNKKYPNDLWEEITEEYVKEELLTNSAITIEIGALLIESFNGTMPKSEEENDPNQKTGQVEK